MNFPYGGKAIFAELNLPRLKIGFVAEKVKKPSFA